MKAIGWESRGLETGLAQYLNFLVDSRGEDVDESDSKLTKALSKLEIKMDMVKLTKNKVWLNSKRRAKYFVYILRNVYLKCKPTV